MKRFGGLGGPEDVAACHHSAPAGERDAIKIAISSRK
jgi:hypothetical protein